MDIFLFYFCGTVMLVAAVATAASRRAMAAAGWLLLALLAASGLLAALHAPFLAVLQVLVHAGAIMAPFLVVIMMRESPDPAHGRRWIRFPLSLLVGAPAVLVVALAAVWLRAAPGKGFSAVLPAGFGQPARVSRLLMADYLLVFELAAILLLVAVVGALALVRNGRVRPWK